MKTRSMRAACFFVSLVGAPACVPPDEAEETGSIEFTFEASARTREGISFDDTEERIAVDFERVVLGFKTMTIGKIGEPDLCAYRGRGAASDVVFDPRKGLVQSFNGIQPADCPDVGIIFGPPGARTTLGEGVSSSDLVELATGRPAHAIVEATATWMLQSSAGTRPRTLAIKLRFDSERTATRFAGCRAAARGVRVLPNARDAVTVRFAAENLFRDAISTSADLRVRPFFEADESGDRDGVVTMAELDDYPLSRIFYGFYQLPDGTRRGSLGDFVRALFRFTIQFRTEEGICVGNEPGSGEEG